LRLLCSALLLAASLAAQRPNPPRVYAIEGARIVGVSAAAIESGTVVIRDGLIEAVGANVSTPLDAWPIDGAGLTVYPGFIDARSTLGMQPPRSPSGGKHSAGPQDRPSTNPWLRAADVFEASDGTIEKWRAGGFTSIAATPQQGIFPGQLSILNLGKGRLQEQVVAPSVALAIRIPDENEAYSGYPGALLGRVAYVRQIFLDARTQQQALGLYDKNPVGLERPVYDRALTPLIEILEARKPALYPANTATEISRALALAAEDAAPQFVIYGAQQAYADGIAEALARARIPALLDVSWPKAPSDPDPESEPALRTLRFRKHAPESAAALAKAGAAFAFYHASPNSPEDLLAGVRAAVQAGLSESDALEALTLTTARVYGVDDRLGSIEVGKIANLSIFADNPLQKKAEPKMVFVDGRRYDAQ
jgi:imidazolonepropionase-like amidohydrolase